MAKVSGIELQGLDELQKAFKNMPEELNASVIQNIARKPGNKIVSYARKLFTPKATGATKRTFGILRVKDRLQKYIEVGIKGRSLAWVFMLGAPNRKRRSGSSTGSIQPIGNVIQEAAGSLESAVTKEMSIDLSKVIAKVIKKYTK